MRRASVFWVAALAAVFAFSPAMAGGLLPFGLGWGDSVAQAEAALKKKTTNVHFVKEENPRPERVVIESRKFYDDHPFTVRCLFYRNRLQNIAIYAHTAGFRDNLKRAGELARKIFLARVKKYPGCGLLERGPHDGGQKYVYRSDSALVDISWGRIRKTGAAVVLVVWRRPRHFDNPFPDSGTYSAFSNYPNLVQGGSHASACACGRAKGICRQRAPVLS